MTLKEFDNIRPILPPDTQVIVKITTPPDKKTPALESAIYGDDFGNHDGRFSLRCRNCGWISDNEYVMSQRDTVMASFSFTPCPKCGSVFSKTNRRK